MMGVMAKSRVSMAAVRNTEVRDVLGANKHMNKSCTQVQ